MNSTIKFAAVVVCLASLAACGNKEAEKQARCTSEGNSTHSQAMMGVKVATDEGSMANTIAKAAAEQARAYTFSECMKK
jgi:predicted small lipoprotein YifL